MKGMLVVGGRVNSGSHSVSLCALPLSDFSTKIQICTYTSVKQSLTRVSISRKSREEITHIFLSRAGELYFHFSFSSRFSRFLDNKSLSFLDLQDFLNQFSFSSRFSRL